MNPKSLKDLKNLVPKLVNKPKLIDKLDELRMRYAQITEELEKPDVYKARKVSSKLHKEQSRLEKPMKHFESYQTLLKTIEETSELINKKLESLKIRRCTERVKPVFYLLRRLFVSSIHRFL